MKLTIKQIYDKLNNTYISLYICILYCLPTILVWHFVRYHLLLHHVTKACDFNSSVYFSMILL